MSKKILAYNAYLQVFALFDDRKEAEELKSQMRKCGHMIAIVDVEQFATGTQAFQQCAPKPVVIEPDRPSRYPDNSRKSRYDNRNSASSRSSEPDPGYRNNEDMFRATIASYDSTSCDSSSYSSSDSGSSCGGD